MMATQIHTTLNSFFLPSGEEPAWDSEMIGATNNKKKSKSQILSLNKKKTNFDFGIFEFACQLTNIYHFLFSPCQGVNK